MTRTNNDISTKELLDTAAAEVIAEHGEKFSVRDICQRAGVAIGSFYTYYKSKDEIILGRLAYMDRHLMNEVLTELSGSCAEKLIQFSEGYLLRSIERGLTFSREIYKAILFSEVDIDDSRERKIYKLVNAIIKKGQEIGELRDDMTAEALSDMTITVMRGIAYDWCYKAGAYDITAFGKETMRLWIKGLLKE